MKQQTLVKHHPKNLYAFPEKDEYRETIWATFAKELNPATAKILFFPGKLGLEIEVAIRYGFKEENLIACDKSKALIASAQWHKQYPKIRCYGNELSRTIDRLVEDKIILNGANLDFCSNLCSAVLDDVRKLVVKPIHKELFIMCVTLLKGREPSAMVDIAKLVFQETGGALDRISLIDKFINKIVGIPSNVILSSSYRSNSKQMCYGIFSIKTEVTMIKKCWEHFYKEFDDKLIEGISLLEDAIDNCDDVYSDDIVPDKSSKIYHEMWEGELNIRREIAKMLNLKRKNGTLHTMAIPIYRSENAKRFAYLDAIIWNKWVLVYEKEKSKLQDELLRTKAENISILQAGYAYR